jgi:hypothetical protein
VAIARGTGSTSTVSGDGKGNRAFATDGGTATVVGGNRNSARATGSLSAAAAGDADSDGNTATVTGGGIAEAGTLGTFPNPLPVGSDHVFSLQAIPLPRGITASLVAVVAINCLVLVLASALVKTVVVRCSS